MVMKIEELIKVMKEYNKTLSPIGMSSLEKQMYKAINESSLYISFPYISEAKDLGDNPYQFLETHHHFSKLLKDKSYLLTAYILHLYEYSFNKSYLRISARSLNISHHYTYLLNKIGSFYIYIAGNLNLKDLIYGQYRNINYNTDFSPVIAAYLLVDDKEAIEYCKDVLLSENNTGVITRDLIQAIEMSHNEELQDLLLDVFLAARLQEGLRQAISETCDEYQTSFFKKALKVIIDNHLIRYSSIQRAVLSWGGLGTDHYEEKDVKVLLSLFEKYMLENHTIDDALKQDNPLEIYIALYSIGFYDSEKAVETGISLLNHKESHKVASILTYLSISNTFKSDYYLNLFDLYKDNDWIMAIFFSCFHNKPDISKKEAYDYYFKIEEYARVFKPKKNIKTKGFEWLNRSLEEYQIITVLYNLLTLNITKETLTLFLPYLKYCTYYKDFKKLVKKINHTVNKDIRKKYYIQNIMTNDTRLLEVCKNSLIGIKLEDSDIALLEEKLKSKRSHVRSTVMEIINKQSIDLIKKSHDRLKNKTGYMGDAADELERKYPEVFNVKQEKVFYGLNEGFHLFHYVKPKSKDHPSYLATKKASLFKKRGYQLQYNFKKSKKEITQLLTKWSQLFEEHSEENYQFNGEDYILGDVFQINYSLFNTMKALPIHEIWEDYLKKNPIDNDTLYQIFVLSYNNTIYETTLDEILVHENVFDIKDIKLPYLNQVLSILKTIYHSQNINSFSYDLELFEFFLKTNTKKYFKHQYGYQYSVTEIPLVSYLIENVVKRWKTDEEFIKAFYLYYDCFNMYDNQRIYSPIVFSKAYRLSLISKDELYSILFHNGLLSKAYIECYFHNRRYYNNKPDLSLYALEPFSKEDNLELRNVLSDISDCFLKMETHRLNEETPVTQYLSHLKVIKGLKYIPMILRALGRDSFSRSEWGTNKNTVLTELIRNTYPSDYDDLSLLDELSETRIVEICMLAPQWIEIFDQYLKWDGFISGCYYFIAHMKTYENQDKKKAIIVKYTNLEPCDLTDGAFDAKWCKEVYQTLGEKRFNILYKASKYLCDNAFHTRARKYADACLNKMNKEDTLKLVKDKRNKDLLNAYCIIPIKDDNDLKERYLYIQQFLKESKKFGSQRQASEKRCCEIALMNLARNTVYQTPTRLSWAVETQIVKDEIDVLNPHSILDYQVYIEIDDLGKNNIIVINPKNKKQKSIPAKIKKLEEFIKIQDIHKIWNEQFRRSKKMLEEAMEDRIIFSKNEILTILENPIVAPMLQKILFIQDEHIGYIVDKQLQCLNKTYDLKDELRIAHCYDLYKSQHWDKYQQEVFDKKLVQPFKQVFRELYTKLDVELDKNETQRYSGYQIQVKKAVGALKSRKWNINYESGIERVYYKDNLIVNLYAQADWFSPSEIETPAIDYVTFHNRKDYKPVLIKDIDDIVYSEAMRDLDLAVSVAYVGGVDPITSFSTIELRKKIIELTARLMKLDNIELKDNFAYINGKLGYYHVHLGSGVIHQKFGHSIHVLPVHSQRRGKLFLPFIDDDPKCQEILSKIIMLSEDHKLKDPSIIQQITVKE